MKISQNTYAKELSKAEAFLNELLFENGGCFTLLGSKPLTSLLVHRGDPKDSSLENLSKEALESLTYNDICTAENFAVWQRIVKKNKFRNFFIVEIPLKEDPISSLLLFANIRHLKIVLEENQDKISKIINVFDMGDLLNKLQNGQEDVWHLLLENHYLAGILYGYGEENVKVFGTSKRFSDECPEQVSKEQFPIPIFAISPDDKTSKRYRVERKLIKNFFKNRSLLEATFSCLQSNMEDEKNSDLYSF